MITTNAIKQLIPTWLTDMEIERLKKEFDPSPPASDFKNKRWVRMFKMKTDVLVNNGWWRGFDCPFFDGQLRLYVYTNENDTEILTKGFMTE